MKNENEINSEALDTEQLICRTHLRLGILRIHRPLPIHQDVLSLYRPSSQLETNCTWNKSQKIFYFRSKNNRALLFRLRLGLIEAEWKRTISTQCVMFNVSNMYRTIHAIYRLVCTPKINLDEWYHAASVPIYMRLIHCNQIANVSIDQK